MTEHGQFILFVPSSTYLSGSKINKRELNSFLFRCQVMADHPRSCIAFSLSFCMQLVTINLIYIRCRLDLRWMGSWVNLLMRYFKIFNFIFFMHGDMWVLDNFYFVSIKWISWTIFQVVTGLLPALIIEIRPQPEVTGKTRIYLDKRTNTWKTTKIPNVTWQSRMPVICVQ